MKLCILPSASKGNIWNHFLGWVGEREGGRIFLTWKVETCVFGKTSLFFVVDNLYVRANLHSPRLIPRDTWYLSPTSISGNLVHQCLDLRKNFPVLLCFCLHKNRRPHDSQSSSLSTRLLCYSLGYGKTPFFFKKCSNVIPACPSG